MAREVGLFVDVVDVRHELASVVGPQVREPVICALKTLLHFLLKQKEV